MKKIKCLFISHVPVNTTYGGGAAVSLKTFIEHQNFLEIDLVLPLFIGYLFKWPYFIRRALALKSTFVRKIYFLPLPYNNCQEGAPISFKAKAAYFVNNLIARLFLPIIKKITQKENYKFVHLNSLVLNQLINPNNQTQQVVHVREVINQDSPLFHKAINNLLMADGLIFIDPRTRNAIKRCSSDRPLPCNSIINNPFNMALARQWRSTRRQEIFKEFNFEDLSKKLFAYIGMLHPIKGTDLIIKAFIEAGLEKAKLLIVGSGNPLYLKQYQSLASRGSNNIIFMGKIKFQEMMKIYAISDFVVRGDPDFRIGRTTFEALFSGCQVIIPGEDEDLTQEQSLQPFKSKVFLYSPGDKLSLAETFKKVYKTSSLKIDNKDFPNNNIQFHCNEFKKILISCNLL